MQRIMPADLSCTFAKLLLAALFWTLPHSAMAQDAEDVEPKVTGIGARMSLAGARYISIHRQNRDKNEPGTIVHYFHMPLFILQTSAKPVDDLPKIVVKQPSVIGDKTYLTFGLILTTPQFQEDARAFVIAHDPDLHVPGSRVDLNAIQVDGWPIITLRVKVVERFSNVVLGSWLSPPLGAAPPTLELPIGFDSPSLDRFKALAPKGEIEFRFSYTFKNVGVLYATAITSASQDVSQALQEAVTSSNISPDTPIFQRQAADFRSKLSKILYTTVSANSKEVIPLVQSQIADHFLSQSIVDITNLQDKPLQEAIYAYLKPLLQSAQEKRTTEVKSGTSTEEGVDVKLGADVKFVNFAIDLSDKDTISRNAAVTFEKSGTNQWYEPHDIKVYKLSQISDDDTLEVVSRAFISEKGDTNFHDDFPVKSDFTEDVVGSYKSAEKIADFDGVLPGMGFCYFGKDIPRGYMELDGRALWPDAAWVQKSLRGKPMPDSQDLLLGSTRRAAEVGQVWNQGKIQLGPISVPPAGFELKQESTSRFVLAHPRLSNSRTDMNPQDVLSIGAGAMANGVAGFSATLQLENGYIIGTASGSTSPIPLNTIATSPQNIRCRLIVKK